MNLLKSLTRYFPRARRPREATTTKESEMNEQDEAFQAAIQAHQLALAVYGDDHPKTTEAMLALMLLAPPEVFAALEEMAAATFH